MNDRETPSRQRLERRALLQTTALSVFGIGTLSELTVVEANDQVGNTSDQLGLDVTVIEADPEAGFEYPYFLYAPAVDSAASKRPLLVQPNNSGSSTDEFATHKESAEERITDRFPRSLSDDLDIPLLVPVFPRPSSDPVNWRHYVHALDVTTMRIEDGPLERVDLQLIAMIEDAQDRLSDLGYPVADDILMNGFSAAGNFVNRFVGLHPELVRAASPGGINGTALLPLETDRGNTLPFHVGISDLEDIIGEPFDETAWAEVDQLVWMGGDDTNDTIPYSDAWDGAQRELALEVYGEHMQIDRMPYCQDVYRNADFTGRVHVYPNVGHSRTNDIAADIRTFHRKHLDAFMLETAGPLTADITTISVIVGTGSSESTDAYSVRIFHDGTDVTADPLSIGENAALEGQITLETTTEINDTLTIALIPAESSTLDDAIETTAVTVHSALSIADAPIAGEQEVTIEYELSGEYEPVDVPILAIVTQEGGFAPVTELAPGEDGTVKTSIDDEVFGVPFIQDRTLRAVIVDDDPNVTHPIGSARQTVGEPATPVMEVDIVGPGILEPGDTATAEVALRKLGGDDGSVSVELSADEETVDERSVSLDVGGTATESFTILTEDVSGDKIALQAYAGEASASDTLVIARKPAIGEGSDAQPYEVTTGGELAYIDVDPAASYEVAEDIDLGAFEPYATLVSSEAFTGRLDGNDHTIDGLTIEGGDSSTVGLIGRAEDARISDLHLTNIAISGDSFVGGLVGRTSTAGEIERILVTGSVSGRRNVGGVVGGGITGDADVSSVEIREVVADVDVAADERRAGGIIGQSSGDSVRDSISMGGISASGGLGGIIGTAFFGGEVERCVATGEREGRRPGGLVGDLSEGTIIDSFWDLEATGVTEEDGDGEGVETDALIGMDATEILDAFDFETTWRTRTDPDRYPSLRWLDPTVPYLNIPDVPLHGQEFVTVHIDIPDDFEVSDLEIRMGDGAGEELTAESVPVEPGKTEDSVAVPVDPPLAVDTSIVAYLQSTGSFDPESALVATEATVAPMYEIAFSDPPIDGDEIVQIAYEINERADEEELEIRVGITDGEDLTSQPIQAAPGDATETETIQLDRAVKEDEELVAVIQVSGPFDPDESLKSVGAAVQPSLFIVHVDDMAGATDETEPTISVTVTIHEGIDDKFDLRDSVSRIFVFDGETESAVIDEPPLAGGGTIEESFTLELEESFSPGDELIIGVTTSPNRDSLEEVAASLQELTTTVVVTGAVDYYATEEIVDTNGLRDAVEDWRAGDIDTELLRDVVGYWRGGEPLS